MTDIKNDELDSLDHEFQRQLYIAKILMASIHKPEDRAIISQFIKRCVALNEENIYIKKNRNEFFRFLLQTLHTATQIQPKEVEKVVKEPVVKVIDPLEGKRKQKERLLKFWSTDRRSYTSAKVIPGYGVLIYMAVSSDPAAGWRRFEIEDIQNEN